MLNRVMVIAGEASGDMHGSGVVRELKNRFPAADIYGIGGDLMKKEGMELLYHIRSVSVMGFVEVIRHLPLIRQIERRLAQCLKARTPQVVVLIDYPGFNLRFARAVHRRGIKVLYYISPQVWAWNSGRIGKMKGIIDEMNVVFPFEVELYQNEGVKVEFVGHPLLERLSQGLPRTEFLLKHGLDPQRKLVALLPGSRAQEIRSIFPTMLGAAAKLRDAVGVQVAAGLAPGLGREFMHSLMSPGDPVTLIEDGTYGLMEHADAVVVTSGTATLETAWFATPMVVVYKTSWLTYALGRMLVKVPWIALANIVAGRQVVPELIQGKMTVGRVSAAVKKILEDETYAKGMRRALAVVRERLGTPGASIRVAEHVISLAEAA